MALYAMNESGYRSITADMPLNPGETKVTVIPAALLSKIKGEQMKVERSQLLRNTDWTQMDDAPLSSAQRVLWAAYRQALRDLPAATGFPDVPWPAQPSLDGAAGGVVPVIIP